MFKELTAFTSKKNMSLYEFYCDQLKEKKTLS